jgi:hypothetical protein
MEGAIRHDWTRAVELAMRAFAFLRSAGRSEEGAEILYRLRSAAEERGDGSILDQCDGELSWIEGWPGPPRVFTAEQGTLF